MQVQGGSSRGEKDAGAGEQRDGSGEEAGAEEVRERRTEGSAVERQGEQVSNETAAESQREEERVSNEAAAEPQVGREPEDGGVNAPSTVADEAAQLQQAPAPATAHAPTAVDTTPSAATEQVEQPQRAPVETATDKTASTTRKQTSRPHARRAPAATGPAILPPAAPEPSQIDPDAPPPMWSASGDVTVSDLARALQHGAKGRNRLYYINATVSSAEEPKSTVAARALVDTGAQEVCMGREFYTAHAQHFGRLQETDKLAMLADDRAARFDGYFLANIATAGVITTMKVYIMPGRSALILGMPWLDAAQAILIAPFNWLFALADDGEEPTFAFLPNLENPPPFAVDPASALKALSDLRRAVAMARESHVVELSPAQINAVATWAARLPGSHHDFWPQTMDAADAQDSPARSTDEVRVMSLEAVTGAPGRLSEKRRARRKEWQPHYPFGGPTCTPERADEVVSRIEWGKVLGAEEKRKMEELVREKQHVFGQSVGDLASSHKVSFDIDVDESVKCPNQPRRPNFTEPQQAWMTDYIDKLLGWGVVRRIEPHEVKWISHLQLVPKVKAHYQEQNLDLMQDLANDTLKEAGLPYDPKRRQPPPDFAPVFMPAQGHRLVHDYRQLNQVSRRIAEYPFGGMDTKVSSLAGYTYYATLDMLMGYFVIPATERAQRYLAFFVEGYGYLTYTRMPFGPEEAPARFNHFATLVFGELERSTQGAKIVRWMDDLIVAAHTFDDFHAALRKIFELCEDCGASLSAPKTTLGAPSVKWCGNLISKEGVTTDPAKVAAIVQWSTPQTALDVLQFISTASFLRNHIPNFSKMAAPLIALTNDVDVPKASLCKKGVRKRALKRSVVAWRWGDSEQKSFALMKAAIAFSVTAGSPDFNRDWFIETTLTPISFGVILLQKNDNNRKQLITAASKLCSPQERSDSTILRELRAVRFAFEKFESYIKGGRIIVKMDCLALRDLLGASKLSPTHLRWREFLLGYNVVKWEHRKAAPGLGVSELPAGEWSEADDAPGEGADIVESWEEKDGLVGKEWIEGVPEGYRTRGVEEVSSDASRAALEILSKHREGGAARQRGQETSEGAQVKDSVEGAPDIEGVPDATVKSIRLAGEQQELMSRFEGDPLHPLVVYLCTLELDGSRQENAHVRRRANSFYIKHGLLYYIPRPTGQALLAIPQQDAVHIIKRVHEQEGHYGRDLILARVRKEGYYWADQRSLIEKTILACEVCQKWGPKQKAALLGPVILPQPYDLMAMDFVRLVGSDDYALVFVDYFSHFTWAFVGPQNSQTVIQALRKLATIAMLPVRLLADNGSHFDNHHVRSACQEMGISLAFVAVYAPWSNGVVERQNGLLITQLRRLCEELGTLDWKLVIDVAVRNVNQRVIPSLGYSPQELLFGIVSWGAYAPKVEQHDVPTNNNMPQRIVEIRQALVDVLREGVTSQQVAKAGPGLEVGKDLAAGDLVMVRRQDPRNKLESEWRGPVRIVRTSANAAHLESLDGIEEKRPHHFTNLKRFYVQTSK